MASREVISLYFLIGCLGFVGLFVLCVICSVVCPYSRTRAFCLERCCGYEDGGFERYKKLQQEREALRESEYNARRTYPAAQGSFVM